MELILTIDAKSNEDIEKFIEIVRKECISIKKYGNEVHIVIEEKNNE